MKDAVNAHSVPCRPAVFTHLFFYTIIIFLNKINGDGDSATEPILTRSYYQGMSQVFKGGRMLDESIMSCNKGCSRTVNLVESFLVWHYGAKRCFPVSFTVNAWFGRQRPKKRNLSYYYFRLTIIRSL